jgi:hypothetical protein
LGKKEEAGNTSDNCPNSSKVGQKLSTLRYVDTKTKQNILLNFGE